MTIPKARVLGYRCLVEIDVPKLEGGLVLPDDADRDKKRGTVVALGDGRVNDTALVLPMPVKVGDHVLLSAFAVLEYTEGGVLYVIAAAQDCIAIVP